MSAETGASPTTRVELTRDGAVATIRFVSDRGVNVFSSAVLGALGREVERIAEDSALRCVVFTGSGRTFVAGADIAEMSRFGEDQAVAFSKHGHHVMNMIEMLPQVTYAAINGHALGGGCELALACDFRIMARAARIGLPESTLGLIPGWGGTQRLPPLVGLARAKRLLFSGEQITAERALAIGLVDEVVEQPEDLPAALRRWCDAISNGAPNAVVRIKRALFSGDEIHQFGCCFSCADAHEGMHAFLEKRKPSWTCDRS